MSHDDRPVTTTAAEPTGANTEAAPDTAQPVSGSGFGSGSGATKTPTDANTELAEERTDLAEERTAMAAERTLMAWVRTGLSMIAFGYAIYRFLLLMAFDAPAAVKDTGTARVVGLVLMGLGVLSTVAGLLEYRGVRRTLHFASRRYAVLIAALVAAFGAVLFIDTLLRSTGVT